MYGSITKFSDGLVAYATIAPGVTSGWAEAIVGLAEHTGSGDGTLIGAEIDIGNTHASNSAHCDTITATVSYCHTNLWLSNTGTVNGSWVMDTGNGGAGWNNGISLRYIATGGKALDIPQQTLITAGPTTIATVDTSNNLQIGSGATSVNLNAYLNGSGSSFNNQTINNSAGTTRALTYQTAGSAVFALRVSNEAQTGSNAGSNFNIDRYSDAGAFLDSPLNINRATGLVTVADGLTVPGTMNAGAVQSAGVTLKPLLSGTSGSIGGASLAAGACTSGTVAVTGATTSMVAHATPVTYPGDGNVWGAYVSSSNTVTVKVCAIVAGTPTASTYNVRVLQ